MATELAKAYVQIVPSAEGMKGMITKELGGEADSAGKSAGISIAGAVKKAIVAAGIGTALKAAITEGAALEQSIGGIETLFKDSADKMKQYAKDAYQTAGVSANDYMEQATSFSASLLQSVGGDTQKAAEAANQAIIDMADNSNKMGTNLQDIQNAYQGFAKQNYTMLDNLKLGYGGTKEEMARLLADAEKLTGVKYDISNLSDVYQAIHAIQDNLNITGTTAEEAASTLSGSLASMKASFTNLLGYWTIGEDVKPYITQFVQSAATFLFQNLVPAIGNILVQLPAALGTFITTALPMIAEQGRKMVTALTDAIQNDLPKMLDEGTAGIENFIAGMISKIPEVITGTGEVLANLLDAILTAMPKFAGKGAEIIKNLVSGLIAKLPDIAAGALKIITKIAVTIINHLPDIIAAGIKIIASILSGIIKGIPKLVAGLTKVVSAIFNHFKQVNWGSVGKAIISGIAKGIRNGISSIANAAKEAAKSALDAAKNFLGIHSPSRVFQAQVGEMMARGMAAGITDGQNEVNKAIKTAALSSTKGFDTSFSIKGEGYAQKSTAEDILNGISGMVGKQSETYTINLNVDGKTLAQVIFDPLEELTMKRRVAIGY